MMFIGIDVGTSGVKAILGDGRSLIADSETVSLPISRPKTLWSEQNPADWMRATIEAIDALARRHPDKVAQVRGIGLAGQMHGAVALDKNGEVIRPAILWNDGRCEEECRILETKVPSSRAVTGNIAMPGFTAPKLLWMQRHEPENFEKIDKVVLPKDYVRYILSGSMRAEMSDAAGTLWLDVKARRWSDDMLAACGLSQSHMPALCEGTDVAGELKSEYAARWGMKERVVLAGGGGDNAAGAVGVGAVREGAAFISLGTSGVYFAGTDSFRACPEKTVHAFCHAVPKAWHQMGVILSAASCIKAAVKFLGGESDQKLAELVSRATYNEASKVVFLPYLSGERTPHNDPSAMGVFFGLTHETTRADMVQAILEGVAFAFLDCQNALAAAGTKVDELMLIGGGARNKLWGAIIAAALNKRVLYVKDGDQGPAFGGARLARIAVTGEALSDVLIRPEVIERVDPDMKLIDVLSPKASIYGKLYAQMKPLFSNGSIA